MWSRQIGEDIDVSVPLYPNEHFYIITEPIKGLSKFTGFKGLQFLFILKEDAGKMLLVLNQMQNQR